MRNKDIAAQVIWDAQSCGFVDPSDLADVLNEAGLLAPDLPEPTKLNRRNEPIWETEGHTRVRTPGGFPVALNGPFGEGWDMFPVEARDIAYALLAACEYSEKEQESEGA